MTPERETIPYLVDHEIATITLNRPEKMNAFTREMADEIIAALDAVDRDDCVSAIVFTGAGGRAFCAGADLTESKDTFDVEKRPDGYDQNKVGGQRSDDRHQHTHSRFF